MAKDTRRITYEGSPNYASFLVHCLEEEGVEVEWTPPREYRGGRDIVQDVVIGIIASGTFEAMRAGVKKFRERFKARIEIEGDEADEDD